MTTPPLPLRLQTHRVEAGERILCDQTGTRPEAGDMVFQFTNRHGEVRSFRAVRFAEAYIKNFPTEHPDFIDATQFSEG